MPSQIWSPTEPRLTYVRAAKRKLTIVPPFDSHGKDSMQGSVKHDSSFDFGFGYDNSTMAGSPYIKPEPNDYNFDPNQFIQYPQGQQFTSSNGVNINPASLSNGNIGMQQNFGQGNMSSSFNVGNSGIADDELLDLDFQHNNQQNSQYDFNQGMQHVFNQQQQQMGQQGTGLFSHTPDDAPIQSPFTHDNFNYAQFRTMGGAQMTGMPHSAGYRPQIQHIDRKVSDSRSPATPSGMGNLQMGDDFPQQGMQQIRHQRQQGSMGNGWDSTPSHHSWNESSPFPSPVNGPVHHQISEVLGKNTHHHHHKVASSLPAKMEGPPTPAFQTQEAKRRRRRESHNLVERRRRDNINERIQDLGQLVPQHRLDDEKVRKHLQTNAPLSPSIANDTGMSPPNAATSLLAGPQGRRATGAGGITQGLPIEDKDKGPNKGDILNGSVAWTRDLMWYLHKKMREEVQLKNLVEQLGGAWPFEQSEDEKRMHSEICYILNKHAPAGGFEEYSRASGTGLRVPGFTNMAGDAMT